MHISYAIKRAIIQACASVAQNPFVQNLWIGSIFKGDSKFVCAPGLNCWSCPAAAFACPIGAMQSLAASTHGSLSFYAIGFVVLIGALIGRLVCGFLCLFGFLQDLLHKIPTPKIKVPQRVDRVLRKLKYLVLIFLVLLLPAIVTDNYGMGQTWFCEFLCPAGTIEAGIPLLAANPTLRDMLGALFTWKALIAAVIVLSAIFISRPFCKYLCPLGAIYGLLNRFSILKLSVDDHICIHCGKCSDACTMDINVTKEIETSPECIRCGVCKSVCPTSAISWTALDKKLGRSGAVCQEVLQGEAHD